MRWTIEGKRCIVTGANSGIGFETALSLSQQGAKLILICRNPSRGEEACERIAQETGSRPDLLLCDFSKPEQIARVASEVRAGYERLDVLINNAGAYFPTRKVTETGWEMTFAVNHLGYVALTHHLLPLLEASAPSRIVNVASRAHSYGKLDFDDLDWERRRYRAMRVYGTSKLCNILYTKSLAARLAGTGVTANCLHPGVIATEFGQDEPGLLNRLTRIGKPFLATPKTGARTSIHLATAPELSGTTGAYFARCRPVKPRPKATDELSAEKLWRISYERLGLVDS